MSKGTILCIDDMPNLIVESSKQSLQESVRDIFSEFPYDVIFQTTGEKGLCYVEKNKGAVKLVLLDINFEGTGQKMQGSEIADKLMLINPYLKIIILTSIEDTGKKRSFGWKANVAGYIVKKDIADAGNIQLLRNLSKSLIEDPDNKRWILHLDTDNKKVTLQSDAERYSFSIPRSPRKWLLLEACANNPNECVGSFDIEGFIDLEAQYPEYVNKEVSGINEIVIKKTGWRLWGILSTDCDTKSSAKLVIGDVKIDESETPSYKRLEKPYVTRAYFEDYRKQIEERLKNLEQEINFLRNQTK